MQNYKKFMRYAEYRFDFLQNNRKIIKMPLLVDQVQFQDLCFTA